MGIITATLGALSAVGNVAKAAAAAMGLVRDERLREEGENRAENISLKETVRQGERANRAARRVRNDPDSLRGPDKYSDD